MQDWIPRNYHTHTARCKHAENTDADYAEAACRAGFRVLGFSDHTPWPFSDGHVSRVRMDVEQLMEYCASVRALGEKYAGRMKLLLGLECEAFLPHFSWLKDKKEELSLDYLILGSHFSDESEAFAFARSSCPEDLRLYTRVTVKAMESGLFRYLCHPEVALSRYPEWDSACEEMAKVLCRASLDLNMPLEYNLLGEIYREKGNFGPLGYPLDRFWEKAAERGCSAVVGVDAHFAAALGDRERLEKARRKLKRMGVRLLDALEGLE